MVAASEDFPPKEVRDLVQQVSTLLVERKETVAIVETVAGGLISSSLLTRTGASKFYKGGLTLYSLPSRVAYGGWTQEMIRDYKGPSAEVVAKMARHVRKELESTYSLAESGMGGPTGGVAENRKPGFLALAVDTEKGTSVRELNTGLGADRTANMVRFAVEGLSLLKEVLEGVAKMEEAVKNVQAIKLEPSIKTEPSDEAEPSIKTEE